MILDGVLKITGNNLADALTVLGPDAPPSPLPIKTEAEARTYIESLRDKGKANILEYQKQERLIWRDLNGDVQLFKEHSKSSSGYLPELPLR
jgi:hypothetical protein